MGGEPRHPARRGLFGRTGQPEAGGGRDGGGSEEGRDRADARHRAANEAPVREEGQGGGREEDGEPGGEGAATADALRQLLRHLFAALQPYVVVNDRCPRRTLVRGAGRYDD